MPLFLLDRDGVVVVNQPTNVKTPDQLALIPRGRRSHRAAQRSGLRRCHLHEPA